MGPLFEQIVVPFVKSKNFLNASDEMKGIMMSRILEKVRGAATKMAGAEDPNLWLEGRERSRGRRMKKYMESIGESVEQRRVRMEGHRLDQ